VTQEILDKETKPDDAAPQATIADVRFEHLRDALGLGVDRPRLSWSIATEAPGWGQAAYAVELYGPDNQLREQTGRIESDQSVLAPWPFAP
jgi:alpha-L-rhamnosidase